ncbi:MULTISPECIES: FUSC family protein [Rhodomicrobium]|uniref:FUSC family protein n=1 Tax=Rhodomicrobium TaxID=1068 RepID=UPI0014838512|nr:MULTISPECIES: FUSC family protein [Rhodomicrobium]
MTNAGLSLSGPSANRWLDAGQWAARLRPFVPPLLFGLRLWAAVCLALYLAFWLELENAFWAGTSAAIVCQPSLGASLRKGWFRMVGTVIGAVLIVVLTAVFPQDRVGFLIGLALLGGACAFMATVLHNFASYAAALTGFTAAVIASDTLGATGGPSDTVFLFAVYRATEICLGIVSAGIVLGATDLGDARRRLASQLGALSAEISTGLAGSLALAGQRVLATRTLRRELVGRVIALDPVIDQAIGEASDLRPRSPVLQAAVGGLFEALRGWWVTALHLEQLPRNQAQRDADLVLSQIPAELRPAPAQGGGHEWMADPARMRRACTTAARALAALPARTPSLRLLADRTAEALIGVARALDGLLLLDDPVRKIPLSRRCRFRIADYLPALINAARAFVTIVAVSLFWIVTAWPSGALALVFATITVLLFSPRETLAYAITMGFLIGSILNIGIAAIVGFAILPQLSTFLGFSLALGLVLVPAGFLMALPWNMVVFTAVIVTFVPLLAPANQMTYDPQQFYNAALAIVVGVGAGAFSFRLLPPMSPTVRTNRLLAITLRDMRRLTASPAQPSVYDWKGLIYSRLSALPEQAEPPQRAQLLAALSVGTEIIRLRRVARRFDAQADLDEALQAIAEGRIRIAIERLVRLDRRLALLSRRSPGAPVRLRARGNILAMSEALQQHEAYFSAGAR